MKALTLNIKVHSGLLFLLDNYKDNEMPPTDYIKLTQDKITIQDEQNECAVEMFLALVQHKQLFSDFVDYFYCKGKRKDNSDKHHLMILTYMMINILNEKNKDDVINICQALNSQKVVNFLRFFNKESSKEMLFILGCKYFEEDYTREMFITRIQKNKDLLQDIVSYFEKMLNVQKAEYVREPTKPVTPRVTPVMRLALVPPPPVNTPQEVVLPPAKPVPASMYKEPKINDILTKLKGEHRAASKVLLEEASESTKRLSTKESNRKNECSTYDDKPKHQKRIYKGHKVATNKIPVKKNAAMLLREAARLIKEEEKDIQRMNDLVCGAADFTSYEEMMNQLRNEEEQLKLQDVERKHLLGQLSREEAILARQRILNINKARRSEIEQEKRETEEIVKKMQKKHEEEIKLIIEKTQQIQRNIEANKQNVIQKKHMEAQEVASTSKQLRAEAITRQKEELERRIEIIKEIKALSSIKDLHSNKFDPNETMNIGLLCEMSIAELYERLLLNRKIVKEEIENRQICIRKQKLKQQQFLADTQKFIDECREQKKLLSEVKSLQCKQPKFVSNESKDITELRERLEKARFKRMELTKSSSVIL
ncbi:cilia- and flagella-associated protein 99-like [Macrosteles quadrilineatus]|uniref:cilia- and flagella-associated protein 99-like n=1 Tax=Macrosteles quadrilineatus TaxID=74068 RepID=UPI0023E14ECC|nr:cilia- and flagella-associated protein 99-like [Macrosteles quadrilineatus]